MDIENKDGWLFPNPKKNEKHYLTDEEIMQLFDLYIKEEEWVNNVRTQTEFYDNNPPTNRGEWFINFIRTMNAEGTLLPYPFGMNIITFPSRRHLFRGEPRKYYESIPSLNRKLEGKNSKEKLLIRAIADMRITQFSKFIKKINIVKCWEDNGYDINYKALGQHYGFDTSLLDLTNDVMTALFFATCIYDDNIKRYRSLTKEECEERKYGVIFHTPDWMIDYYNGNNFLKITDKKISNTDKTFNFEDGCLDGIAFQIGMQPLIRCHYQSGYILPMVHDKPLQCDWQFEKLYIKLTPELSKMIYNMMNKGDKVFPNEGINEVLPTLNEIKNSIIFSENDLECAYKNVGYLSYKNMDDFKKDLEKLVIDSKYITIQKNEVDYKIDQGLLDKINAKYDEEDTLNSLKKIRKYIVKYPEI